MNTWLGVAVIISGLALFGWILKKPVRGVYLATFLLPILKSPDLPLVRQQLTVIEPVVLLTLVAWGLWVTFGQLKLRVLERFYIPIVLFLLACVISLWHTRSMQLSLVELVTYVYLFGLFFVTTQLARTRNDIRTIEKMWILAMTLVVALGYVGIGQQRLGIRGAFVGRGIRVSSTLRATNQLSSFLIVPFPLVLFWVLDREKSVHVRIGAGLLALAALPVMLATGARSSFLLLIAMGFLFLLYERVSLRYLIAVGLVALLIGGVFALVGEERTGHKIARAMSFVKMDDQSRASAQRRLDRQMEIAGVYANPSGLAEEIALISPPRYLQMLTWLESVKDYPLFGVGVGAFHEYIKHEFPYARAHEMHNTYLGVWAEEGILGLAMLLLILIQIAREAWFVVHSRDPYLRRVGTAVSMGILLNLVFGLTHFGLRNRHLWMAMAQLVAIGAIARKTASSSIQADSIRSQEVPCVVPRSRGHSVDPQGRSAG